MARRNRLIDEEQRLGKPMIEVIPPLVNTVGQYGAARALNVSQGTISRWLKEHGFKSHRSTYSLTPMGTAAIREGEGQ